MIVDRLQSVCREHRLREKVLVVPSLAIGHQIADAVAFGGTDWVNLRMETIRTISDAVAGFDLAQRGCTVLSRAQALAIIERACDRVLDDWSYFAALIGRPGLYRAIQRSVDDLRHAGLEAELPANAFEDPRKAKDLAAIIAAYEDEMRERKFVDRYGVLTRAIELLEGGASTAWPADTLWFVSDELELSNTEERLLRAAAGDFEKIAAEGGGAPPKDVRFVRAVGEENELRGAFRAILRDRATLDSAEVIYTTRDPYLSLAYELTSEYAIPATFAEGIAATFTRPGQAGIGFLEWIADDFNTVHLRRIARAGAIRTGDAIGPSQFARVLRDSFIGWGRHRYVPRLEEFIAVEERRLEGTDSEARAEARKKEIERRRGALAIAQSLIEVTAPVVTGESVNGGALAMATLEFIDRFAAAKNEIDGMALAALRRMLLELSRLPEVMTPRRLAIDRLSDAVAATHVAASNPRPGHLHVASVRGGGWSGRERFFIVGLDDAKHPGAGLQDPIVLDAERKAINASIPPRHLDLLGDMPARNSARLRRLLRRVPDASLTLSFADLDLRDRRARFPSKDLLDVFRRARNDSEAKYEALLGQCEVAGFLEEKAPLSPTEWWLSERFSRGRGDLRSELLGAHPWIAEGERARAARESGEITVWDGKIDVAPVEIDPRLTGRVISASQIERMARCPFGWFVERVLGIAPIEELVRDQDQWLDPRNFGLLVHEVLEETMLEICDANERPSFAKHLAPMHEIADAAAERWRSEIPPATETAFLRQLDELHTVCEVFLRTEETRCQDIVPRFFEAPFGMADAGNSPIGITDPLVIRLAGGKQVSLRGKIDRIDQDLTSGGWQVWDYKTGSLWEYTRVWRLQRGRKLQHVIYTRALTEMLRAHKLEGQVDCSGYYFPTMKGGGERVVRECAPGELEHALDLLFDVIGSGWFPLPDEGKCDFCEFPEICGNQQQADQQQAAARMARKEQANADDPAVVAWRKLQGVE